MKNPRLYIGEESETQCNTSPKSLMFHVKKFSTTTDDVRE